MLYCCTELKILFNIGRKLDVCHSYVRVLFMYLAWPPVVNFETSRSTTILKPLNICCYSGVFYCWLLGNQGKVRKCRDYFSKRKIFCSQVRFVSCARCLFVYVSLPLFFCFVHVRTLIMFNRTCMSGHEYTSSQIFFLSLHEKVEKHVCTFTCLNLIGNHKRKYFAYRNARSKVQPSSILLSLPVTQVRYWFYM